MISSLQKIPYSHSFSGGFDDLLVTPGDEFTSEIHPFEPRRLRISPSCSLVLMPEHEHEVAEALIISPLANGNRVDNS